MRESISQQLARQREQFAISCSRLESVSPLATPFVVTALVKLLQVTY